MILVKVLLSFILLTFFLKLDAQKTISFQGFIEKNDGDTIFCLVKINSFSSREVKMKNADFGNKFTSISLLQIKSISDKKDLEYLVFPIITDGRAEIILTKKVISGAINLYKGENSNGEEIYFINSNKIPETVQIHPKGVNSFIKNYFRDCPRKEERIYYKYSQILKALEYYHSCLYDGEEFKILEKPNNFIKVGLGYRGMYFYTNPVFAEGGYFSNGKFDSSPSGGGGFLAKVYIKKNWSLELGANFYKYQFSSEEILNPSGNFSRVDFKINVLEVPIAVSYHFDLPLQPHLSIGYSVDFLIKPKMIETPFKMNTEPVNAIFKNENIGFFAGIGLIKSLNPKAELLFQIKYVRENIRVLTQHFDSKKNDFVVSERKLNPNKVEVSASYIFLVKK